MQHIVIRPMHLGIMLWELPRHKVNGKEVELEATRQVCSAATTPLQRGGGPGILRWAIHLSTRALEHTMNHKDMICQGYH